MRRAFRCSTRPAGISYTAQNGISESLTGSANVNATSPTSTSEPRRARRASGSGRRDYAYPEPAAGESSRTLRNVRVDATSSLTLEFLRSQMPINAGPGAVAREL